MPGAFTRGGPVQSALTEMTPEEREAQFYANLKGSAASFADPFGMTSLLAPDSISQPLQEMQEQGSPGTNLFGAAAFPMGTVAQFPKTVGALTGMGAYFGGSDDAEASRKKKQASQPVQAEAQAEDQLGTLVKKWQDKDPTLGALYSSYQQEKTKANQAVQGVDKASADQVRQRANETAQGIFDQITSRIETLDPPRKTFQQRYGGVAENWDKIQAGTGVAVGALLGAKGAMADDMLKYRPWKRTLKNYDKAMDPSPIAQALGRKSDPVRAREQAERLKGFSDKWGTSGKDSGSIAVPMLAGGVAATELGALPDVYNKRYAPEDSPDYQKAHENQSSVGNMLAAYGPMAAIASLGAGTGAKIFGGKDKGPALAARSEPALSRLGPSNDRATRSQAFTKSVEDDVALRATAQPPAPPAPAPAVPTKTPKARTQAAAAPGQPPKPTRAEENVEANKAMEQALSQLRSGKKVNLSRLKKVPPKRLKEIEKIIRNAQADSPNAPPDVVADILSGQNTRGKLKYGVAGAATGYSAVLAERLAKMEEDKTREQ